jgi:arginase
MASIALIGVPSQSGGRPVGVARGVGALRAAGLVASSRTASHEVRDHGDVALPRPDHTRDPVSRVVNPAGLSALVRAVEPAVDGARAEGDFPILVGGDCPMLLGGLAASPGAGLLHVDGHEDAYPPDASPTGDAADSEIAFALGRAAFSWDEELRARQPFLEEGHLVLVGQRDLPDLERHGVASMGSRCSMFDANAVHDGPDIVATKAVGQLREAPGGFWFHLDWDVLSNDVIGSVIFPRPGGITWGELATVTSMALAEPSCRGWSVGTYNPDLDPDGTDAVRIVEFLTQALSALDEREERSE